MGKMSDVALRAKTTKPSHRPCSVLVFSNSLSDEERAEFNAVLFDPEVAITALTRALEDEYHVDLSYQQVGRHRRGECACR